MIVTPATLFPAAIIVIIVFVAMVLYFSSRGEKKKLVNVTNIDIQNININSFATITDGGGTVHRLKLKPGEDLVLQVNVGSVNLVYRESK